MSLIEYLRLSILFDIGGIQEYHKLFYRDVLDAVYAMPKQCDFFKDEPA